MHDLRGKAVVVTGGASGIGAAVSRAFGAAGCRVLVHYLSSAGPAERLAAEIAAAGGEAVAVGGDITAASTLQAIVDTALARFGRIDVLVNNAGTMVDRRRLDAIDDALIDAVFDLNGRSIIHACQAVLPVFRRQGRGNIINVSSIAARNGGSAGAGLYGAVKGFVSTWTRGMARELAPDNIRVNAVSPGVIHTRFHDTYSTPEMLENARLGIPMGRLGSGEDCAGTFLYLASDALSAYVTGQVIEVNGGQLMP